MVAAVYVPERGHFIRTDFNPSLGHEQSGPRPALVLSETAYNRRSGLAVVCPVTKQANGYSFEVAVPAGLPVYGVILADAVKNLDWRAHGAAYLCDAPPDLVLDVLARFSKLVGIPWP